MKFSVKEKPLAVAPPPSETVTVEQISAAYEDLMCSYMELSDAQKNLDEVCQVMENIELSVKMLQNGSADAVKLLNVDNSLENLLGIAEEKISLQAAEEGLGTTVKDLAKKFWETVKQWVEKFVNLVKSAFSSRKKRNDNVKVLVERAVNFDPLKKVEPFNKNVLRDIAELKVLAYSTSDLVGKWFKSAEIVTNIYDKGADVAAFGKEIERDVNKLAGVARVSNEWHVSRLSDAGIKSKQEAVIALKTCEDIIDKLTEISTHSYQMKKMADKMTSEENPGDIKTVQEQRRVVFFVLKLSSTLYNAISHFFNGTVSPLYGALSDACADHEYVEVDSSTLK